MSMLESIEKLREFIGDRSAYKTTVWEKGHAIADEIEREISERYMQLPVDRKGEAWRIGDKFPFAGEGGKKHVCTVSGIGNGEVFFYYDQHADSTKHRHIKASSIVHDKPRTVEDVLATYRFDAKNIYDDPMLNGNERVDKFEALDADVAAELRELLGGEEYAETVRHVKPDSLEELLDDVSKGIICYPRESVTGYLEDNHSIGEAVMLDVRDRLRDLLGGDA